MGIVDRSASDTRHPDLCRGLMLGARGHRLVNYLGFPPITWTNFLIGLAQPSCGGCSVGSRRVGWDARVKWMNTLCTSPTVAATLLSRCTSTSPRRCTCALDGVLAVRFSWRSGGLCGCVLDECPHALSYLGVLAPVGPPGLPLSMPFDLSSRSSLFHQHLTGMVLESCGRTHGATRTAR